MRTLEETLLVLSRLDDRYAQLRGAVATSKDRTLGVLARLFAEQRIEYAVIGGIAVQVWSEDPRSTLDVEIAVRGFAALPRDALASAGFVAGGKFEHSENWTGPDGTPVQFSEDPLFGGAITHAVEHPIGGGVLRVAPVAELLRAKLRAGRDPARRRSKRLMDIADAAGLGERYPDAVASLSADERRELGM